MNETLLKKRMNEAPRTEPADAVKLLYQSAFGCGHLITDETACARRLETELAETPPSEAAPPATLIGNGLCRLNLAAPAVRRLPPARIVAMMRLTAEAFPRNKDSEAAFAQDIHTLESLTADGAAPFSLPALQAYLDDYRRNRCPAVSHSAAYREANHPAYRVVCADFATLLPLMTAIERRNGAGVAVLDGCCGAGKTTLAARLSALYAAPVLHMDDFFLPPGLRTPARLNTPGGNIHYERFLSQALSGLARPEPFAYQRFDCQTGAMLPRLCPAASLRIVEGSYALHPRFRSAYAAMDALTAFVTAAPEEQLRRLKIRDPERLPRFEAEWIPLEKSYFEAYDVKRRAMLVLHSLPWEGEA